MERSRTISLEPSGEQSNNNRLFIFLAIALLGLICIGLVGLAGAIYLYQTTFAEQAAIPSPTIVVPVATATNTSTPSPVPTQTPLPTATGTRVVVEGAEVATAENQVSDTVEATPTQGLALPTAADEGVPTATSTLVVADTPGAGSESTPETATTPAATASPEMPGSGSVLSSNGGFLIWVGMALLAALLFGIWRQFRTSQSS
jgi:nitrate reductase NapE component